MEEETKLLKEALAKRDQELQSARLMCARTASKLSTVEEQLENRSCSSCSTKPTVTALERTVDIRKPNSAASLPEESVTEEAVCAESWASALIAELSHFKKETKSLVTNKMQDTLSFDLMDDFVEMEKLASLSSTNDLTEQVEKCEDMSSDTSKMHIDFERERDLGAVVESNEQAFESVDQLCKELRDKLSYAEGQVNALQAKQSESEATIAKLQHQLAMKFEVEAEGKILSKALEAVRLAMEAEKDAGTQELKDNPAVTEVLGEKSNVWLPNCIPVGSLPQSDTDVSGGPELDVCAAGSELAAAVRKVLEIVEGIAQTDYSFIFSQWMPEPDSGPNATSENVEDSADSSLGRQWRSSGLNACVDSLINLCNTLLQGKVDIVDFIAEVASALDWLVGLIFSIPEKSPGRTCSQRHAQSCKGSPASCDSEVISAGNTPSQVLCNVSDLEEAKARESQDALHDQSSVSDISFQFSEASTHDEELSKIISEKAALKMKLEAEIRRADNFEREVVRLKSENDRLEEEYKLTTEKLADLGCRIHEANKKIQNLNSELLESEIHSSDLQSQLCDSLDKKRSMENTVADLHSAKHVVESQLHYAKENVKALGNKVSALEEELQEEVTSRKRLEMKFQELKDERDKLQRKRSVLSNESISSGTSAEEDAARLKKEQEIAAAAEKLAECQQTILVLGKQLKALGLPKETVDVPFTGSAESPRLVNRIFSSTNTLRSSSEYEHSENDVRDEMLSTAIEDPRASPVLGSTTNERERKQEQGSSRSSKSGYTASPQELEPGPTVRRGQTSGRYGRPTQPEMYRGNTFPSPTRGDNQEGSGFMTGSTMEPVVSSPLRSPARFLSLRNRNASSHDTSKHGDSESSEKHGSGFSRFFARTRSGH